MRKFFSLLILITIGLRAAAQQKNDIQAPLIRLFDGISAIDSEAIKAEVSTDFTLLENGEIWNIDSLITAVGRYKYLGIKRVNKIDFLKTEQKGDTAWVSYYNTADLKFNSRQVSARWLESAVLVKEQGKWKIKLLHELKPAAAQKK